MSECLMHFFERIDSLDVHFEGAGLDHGDQFWVERPGQATVLSIR